MKSLFKKITIVAATGIICYFLIPDYAPACLSALFTFLLFGPGTNSLTN